MFKKPTFIAFLGVILAIVIQEYNISTYNFKFPYNNGLISSADEASYLRPPQNLLEIGEWKDNSNSITAYYQRPPGYGLLFLFYKLILPSNPWILMKIIQIFGYFCSILLFFKLLSLFEIIERLKLIATYTFIILPCFSGFIYFTITEGISPFLMLLCVYTWVKAYQKPTTKNKAFFVLTSVFFLLVRPQLLIFILFFHLAFLLRKEYKSFAFLTLMYIPLVFWNIRNISINGSFPGLHPIYSYTNNGLYRPSHEKMTELYRIWEYRSDIFHTSIGVLCQDTTKVCLNMALTYVPPKFHQDVIPIFNRFQQLKFYQAQHIKANQKLRKAFHGELSFEHDIKLLTKQLKSKYWIDYHFKTPLLSFKKLISASHLNLKIFQDDLRGNILIEILRYISLITIISVVCISFTSIIMYHNKIYFYIALSLLIYVFFLTYIQRLNEERYLTPILPIGFALCVYSIQIVSEKYLGNIRYKAKK